MQPELAIALSEVLSACQVGLTTFASSLAALVGLAGWKVSKTIAVSAGFTGCVMLLRSFATSKTVLFYWQILTEREIPKLEKPKPAPPVIPSSSWADDAEAYATKLWDYTFAQIRAAHDEGRQLDKKPWARRQKGHGQQGHGLTADQWRTAMNVWIAGALVDDENTKELNTTSYKYGLDRIREGIATLGFIRSNGESWIPR